MKKQDQDMATTAANARKKSEEGIWDTVKVVIEALLIAFVVRTFLYQPFNIPSGSMYPTLEVGDYLFVSKLSYGYSKYSFNFTLGAAGVEVLKFGPDQFPLLNFTGRKFFAEPPERGDVAVFKLPRDNSTDYIKRVIGLPGDRIQMREGVLYINDEMVKKERIANYRDPSGECCNGATGEVARYRETLPNGVSYEVLDLGTSSADNTEVYVVPEGHYFMMGDNRDNSQDSRFSNAVGFVPYENFVGRADIIFFSIEPDTAFWEVWKWPFAIRWNRFLNLVN
jgi:signal peptidase I